MTGAKTQRFQALDAWRGICALLVTTMHIPIKDSILGLRFFSHAYLFVDFFFVLSGFVIAHAYGSVLSGDAAKSWPFLIKRFGRLWPLHMAVFAFFMAQNISKLALYHWYASSGRPPPGAGGLFFATIEQSLFLQAAIPGPVGIATNGPSWSISTEFWTYVLFCIVTIAFQGRALVKAAIVAVSLLIVYRFSTAGMNVFNWLGFFRCFAGFFAGQLVYSLYASTTRQWYPEWGFAASTVVELAIVLLVVAFLSLVGKSDFGLVAPVLFSLTVYVFAFEQGALSRSLKAAPMQKLGAYSYSIYMIFSLFISSIIGLLRVAEKVLHVHLIHEEMLPDGVIYAIHFGGPAVMLGFAALILTVVVYTSSWTYRLIEKPGQRYFGRQAARLEMHALIPAAVLPRSVEEHL